MKDPPNRSKIINMAKTNVGFNAEYNGVIYNIAAPNGTGLAHFVPIGFAK
jgi:hypothetical protein